MNPQAFAGPRPVFSSAPVGVGALLVLCGVLVGPALPLRAQPVEPVPSYASTRVLREDASLHAIAFQGESLAVVVGDRGTILRTVDGGVSWTARESGVHCQLTDVLWVNARRVVAVGGRYDRITGLSRGVVLVSDDAGEQWRRGDDDELPRLATLRLRDDRSLVALGDWSHAALTHEFDSHDGGQRWRGGSTLEAAAAPPAAPGPTDLYRWARATGLPVPIRDACAVGATNLYAVGDHGMILLSRDRGRNWEVQRGDKRQTSILVVADNVASVPWALVGSEALESRNRVSVLIDQLDSSQLDPTSPIQLAHQVTVMLGGAGADSVRTAKTERLDAATQWIAIHRPAAVVLDESLAAETRDAFFQAATASGVARIATSAFGGGQNTTLHRDALLPTAGVLASDLAADALQYVAPHRAEISSISLRYLYDVADSRRGESITSGLPLATGRFLAARIPPASRRHLQIVQARMNHGKRVEQLTQLPASQFASSLTSMLDQTAAEDRFRLAWSVLQKTTTPGSSGLVEAEKQTATLQEIARRFPTMSAGLWAALRLESLQHSVEWNQLKSTLSTLTVASTTATPVPEMVPVSPFQVHSSGVRQVSAVTPVVVPKPETIKVGSAPAAPRQAEVDLAWEFHPLTLFTREAARRRGDDGKLQVTDGSSANLQRLLETTDNGWSRLLQHSGPQVVLARPAAFPPRLDGVLNDPCWQSALSAAGQTPRLQIAYDDEYVYVAVQCPSDRLGTDQSPPRSARDHDLTHVDRLRLNIDVDQDLMTAMQLQVTDAGRTHDAIDGHPGWQPTWYVASKRSEYQLTFEIAILRRDLVELPIHGGQSWFVAAKPLRGTMSAASPVIANPNEWVRVVFQP